MSAIRPHRHAHTPTATVDDRKVLKSRRQAHWQPTVTLTLRPSSLCDITKGAKPGCQDSRPGLGAKLKKASDAFKDTKTRRSILHIMFDAYATYAAGIFRKCHLLWKISIVYTHMCIQIYIHTYVINIPRRYLCAMWLPCLRKLPKDNISYQLNTQKPHIPIHICINDIYRYISICIFNTHPHLISFYYKGNQINSDNNMFP